MATMSVNDVTSDIGKYGREFAPATFAGGFIYGATNDISYQGGLSVGSVLARTQDTIARVTGVQLNLGSGYGKTTQTARFNATNIANGGTYGAIGLEVAYGVSQNRWVKLLKDVFQPPLAGYGIGKAFDDAPFSGGGQSGRSTTAGAGYQIAAGNPNLQRSLVPSGGYRKAPFGGKTTF